LYRKQAPLDEEAIQKLTEALAASPPMTLFLIDTAGAPVTSVLGANL